MNKFTTSERYFICKKICEKINKYIKNKKYLVRDDDKEIIDKKFVFNDDKYEIKSGNCIWCGIGWGNPLITSFKKIKIYKIHNIME